RNPNSITDQHAYEIPMHRLAQMRNHLVPFELHLHQLAGEQLNDDSHGLVRTHIRTPNTRASRSPFCVPASVLRSAFSVLSSAAAPASARVRIRHPVPVTTTV